LSYSPDFPEPSLVNQRSARGAPRLSAPAFRPRRNAQRPTWHLAQAGRCHRSQSTSVARYRVRARTSTSASVCESESCVCRLPMSRGRAIERPPNRISPACRMLLRRSEVGAIIGSVLSRSSMLRACQKQSRVADDRPTLPSASGEPASRESVVATTHDIGTRLPGRRMYAPE